MKGFFFVFMAETMLDPKSKFAPPDGFQPYRSKECRTQTQAEKFLMPQLQDSTGAPLRGVIGKVTQLCVEMEHDVGEKRNLTKALNPDKPVVTVYSGVKVERDGSNQIVSMALVREDGKRAFKNVVGASKGIAAGI